ncbi:MAG: hypothetical protein U0670_07975 [Anaerolineae bacterium]
MEILVFGLIALLQLPLLLSVRSVPDDEVLCVDTALGIFRYPHVPKARYWAHVLPEMGIQNFYYTPLSFYVLALFLKVFGTRKIAVGILHGLLRFITALLVWGIGSQFGLTPLLNSLLVLSWAIFCYGPTGRPDDLALLFAVTSFYAMVVGEPTFITAGLSGIFLGLAFLSYPAALLTSFTIGAAVLMRYPLEVAVPLLAICGMVTTAIASLWLIWVIPYRGAFKAIFLKFALPDARSTDRIKTLREIVRYVGAGVYTSPIPFHYSLIPVMTLTAYSAIISPNSNLLALLGMIGALIFHFIYLSGLRIHKTYNLLFLLAALHAFAILLLSRQLDALTANGLAAALALVLGGQVAVTVSLALLRLIAVLSISGRYNGQASQSLRARIPLGEAVLTNVGNAYYALADGNPIYTVAGRTGTTYGGVPFHWEFDDRFRWLILASPIASANPYGKFNWTEVDRAFFQANFTLDTTIEVFISEPRRGLTRYAGAPETWFVYRYVG